MQDIQKSFHSGTSGVYTLPDKGEKLAQLMQEAHVAKREKDDAVYRLEQVRYDASEAFSLQNVCHKVNTDC